VFDVLGRRCAGVKRIDLTVFDATVGEIAANPDTRAALSRRCERPLGVRRPAHGRPAPSPGLRRRRRVDRRARRARLREAGARVHRRPREFETIDELVRWLDDLEGRACSTAKTSGAARSAWWRTR